MAIIMYAQHKLKWNESVHRSMVVGEWHKIVAEWIRMLLAVMNVRCELWQGTSVKYNPQRVGLSHQMNHDDVIQIVKK